MNGEHPNTREALATDQRMRLDEPINALIEKTETFEANDGVRIVVYHHRPGLSKREHFAALAMQTLIALQAQGDLDGLEPSETRVSALSVKYADDLLRELAK